MKNKFKKGDKVVLKSIEKSHHDQSSNVGRYAKQDRLRVGKEYVVIGVGCNGYPSQEGEWLWLANTPVRYWHHVSGFELAEKPDALVIVLRRQGDRKPIETFLNTKGFLQDNAPYGTGNYKIKYNSRIIVVHLSGRLKGELTCHGRCTYDLGTNEARERAVGFAKDMFGFKNIVTLNSKPSVNQVIETIKTYL